MTSKIRDSLRRGDAFVCPYCDGITSSNPDDLGEDEDVAEGDAGLTCGHCGLRFYDLGPTFVAAGEEDAPW